MRDSERQQRSREFGIRLAKLLRRHAAETRSEADLDPAYVMRGAADYLRKEADLQIQPPIDSERVESNERMN